MRLHIYISAFSLLSIAATTAAILSSSPLTSASSQLRPRQVSQPFSQSSSGAQSNAFGRCGPHALDIHELANKVVPATCNQNTLCIPKAEAQLINDMRRCQPPRRVAAVHYKARQLPPPPENRKAEGILPKMAHTQALVALGQGHTRVY
jgi:hypothetical protein